QGGCFETSEVTSHDRPTYEKHGVIHYCVPNIASRVSRTASFALSNIFSPILLDMGDKGGCKELIIHNTGFRSGVYIYKGVLTSEVLGKVFDLNYKDIELLLMGMK
ncbi:MAG: alanine dehydrogenase, partial [Crocinitomicaceae bacterium]|nr:alanine dehydrogenase [Crocinitomicaceae bacterium]